MKAIRAVSVSLTMIAVAGSVVLGGCARSGSGETVDTVARSQAQLAREVQQIQNLMSRRAFYHSSGHNEMEFALYAKRPDISWGQNQGFRVGPEAIKQDYVEDNDRNRATELARLSKLYPELKNEPANLGAGIFVMHTLTTPIIEIAEDGQTAKGVWYTPGAIGMVDEKGKLAGNWLWERYAVDFIKEDGQWKFWHILVLTDFLSPMGKDLQPPGPMIAGAPEGTESKATTAAATTQPSNGPRPWTIPKQNYAAWSPTTVSSIAPRLPEPYKTFSETFSYGPPDTK